MSRALVVCFSAGLVVLAALLVSVAGARAQSGAETTAESLSDPAVARGAYVFKAAGCLACHTDSKGGGAPLAGGRPLKTPFGTFYSPNITPDPATGIGAWNEADFVTALRHGTSPQGDPYYPAFPYTSYSGMTDQDMRDLFAYLMAQPPVARENRAHDLGFPYNMRFTLGIWKAMFFEAGAFQPVAGKDAQWNRGAYLVRHLGHCGECHSPRGFLGAVDASRELAGNPQGPDGGKVPNLTPGPGGLGDWSESDIAYALKSGITPDGDFLSDSMGEVIDNATSQLTDEDRTAISIYLKDLTPIPMP
ncbi:cytochrome c [Pelagibius marinus]|uniref:cytochrome c n=1 Tax=Pelagibius marinus TaxID=2762760 RepID=UPI0018733392|nr:cytochrome c [Pelagibius marinus]